MKSIVWSLLFALVLSTFGLITAASSYTPGPFGPRYCPPPQPQPPRSVERTVSVRVPIQRPLPPPCPLPPGCRVPPCPPARPTSVPVRVNVAVTPTYQPKPRMAPVVYCSPGPLKPLVASTVGLIGNAVAAPFRVADMFLPSYHPRLSQRRPRCGPRGMYPSPYGNPCAPRPPCAPPVVRGPIPCPRPCTPRMLCPPPCPPPMKCVPPGPSVCPLPRPACPPPCAPFIPPRMVQDQEFPLLEPRGIIAGVVNFPFRLLQRGRAFGDMNRVPPGTPCMR